ncbi:unnamed protein product [Coffea canephora]|uniref:(+)-neomenthol dehydrogenase n=1 Tax=Coffea canephora TaxID=49390 RepID=A0A068UKV1_COFCA|nr:unnamed protein product [Coffea canephora]
MVVLTARDQKKGIEAVQSLKARASCDNVIFHQLDVGAPSSIASLADFIKTRFGKLDILVNNAAVLGVKVDSNALDSLADHVPGGYINWNEVSTQAHDLAEECLKTNYYGPKSTTEAFAPLLKLSDSGRVVNVSSSSGKLKFVANDWAQTILSDADCLTEDRIDEVLNEFLKDFKEGFLNAKGWPSFLSAYTLSKAALNAYTRIVAKKYPELTINCVCPGYVKTDMNYHRGVLSSEEDFYWTRIFRICKITIQFPLGWALSLLQHISGLIFLYVTLSLHYWLEFWELLDSEQTKTLWSTRNKKLRWIFRRVGEREGKIIGWTIEKLDSGYHRSLVLTFHRKSPLRKHLSKLVMVQSLSNFLLGPFGSSSPPNIEMTSFMLK